MFGLIVAGRPVDATPQAVSQAQYAFRVPSYPAFNHLVLFILPGVQLPPSTAATVFIRLSPSQEFKLLGAIGPGKESAIFKISDVGTQLNGGADADGDIMTDDTAPSRNGTTTATGEIIVGVSIETIAQVEAQFANLKAGRNGTAQPSTALTRPSSFSGTGLTTKVLAKRIIGNAFNFLASFGSDVVPLKAFQDWWTKFEKKIDLDPSLLEREEQG